jgi:hypothetical protein
VGGGGLGRGELSLAHWVYYGPVQQGSWGHVRRTPGPPPSPNKELAAGLLAARSVVPAKMRRSVFPNKN